MRQQIFLAHISIFFFYLILLFLLLPEISSWWIVPDEGIYLEFADSKQWQLAIDRYLSQAHPPLFFLIVWILRFFELDFVSMKVFSLFTSALSCSFFFLFLRRYFSIPIATIGTILFLYALNCSQLSYAIRPYSLQLASISAFLWQFGSNRKGLNFKLICILFLTLMLHFSSYILMLPFGILLLKDSWKEKNLVRFVFLFCSGLLACGVLIERTLFCLDFYGELRDGWLGPHFLANPSSALKLWGELFIFFLPGNFNILFIALSLCGLLFGLFSRDRLSIIFGVAILLASVLSFLKLYPLGGIRHDAYLLPGAIYLICISLKELSRLVEQKAILPIIISSSILLVSFQLGGGIRSKRIPVEKSLAYSEIRLLSEKLTKERITVLVSSISTYYSLYPFIHQDTALKSPIKHYSIIHKWTGIKHPNLEHRMSSALERGDAVLLSFLSYSQDCSTNLNESDFSTEPLLRLREYCFLKVIKLNSESEQLDPQTVH